MTDVKVIAPPPLDGLRRALVLAEDRVGHYPEFRRFFVETFNLDRDGLKLPGYVTAPTGITYALVFIGRSGEPFPAGVEIPARVGALEPLAEVAVDRDLWAILKGMIAGVGGDWTVRDLEETGRLFRIGAAG